MSRYTITEVGADFRINLSWRHGAVEERLSPYHYYIIWDGEKRHDSALTLDRAMEIIEDLELEAWYKSYGETTNVHAEPEAGGKTGATITVRW